MEQDDEDLFAIGDRQGGSPDSDLQDFDAGQDAKVVAGERPSPTSDPLANVELFVFLIFGPSMVGEIVARTVGVQKRKLEVRCPFR